MQKVILALVLLLLLSALNPLTAQSLVNITELKILPDNPAEGDTIQIQSKVFFPSSVCSLDSFEVDIDWQNNKIAVYSFYSVGDATSPCESIDTIVVGLLSKGNYSLVYHATDIQHGSSDSDSVSFTVSGTSGYWQKERNDPGIIIHPNPSRNSFTISVSGNDNIFLIIKDILGREFHSSYFQNKITIPAGTIPEGVYIVQIINTANHQKASRKIILH